MMQLLAAYHFGAARGVAESAGDLLSDPNLSCVCTIRPEKAVDSNICFRCSPAEVAGSSLYHLARIYIVKYT